MRSRDLPPPQPEPTMPRGWQLGLRSEIEAEFRKRGRVWRDDNLKAARGERRIP